MSWLVGAGVMPGAWLLTWTPTQAPRVSLHGLGWPGRPCRPLSPVSPREQPLLRNSLSPLELGAGQGSGWLPPCPAPAGSLQPCSPTRQETAASARLLTHMLSPAQAEPDAPDMVRAVILSIVAFCIFLKKLFNVFCSFFLLPVIKYSFVNRYALFF